MGGFLRKCAAGVFLYFFLSAAVFAVDYGIILGAEGGYNSAVTPEGLSAAGSLSPWFSAVLTERVDVYMSGKMTYRYEEKREPAGFFVFEPERAEINLRPLSAVHITLGRQWFHDSAGLAASGLFDGAGGRVNLGLCSLSLGVYYTGLLYKETAKILMTPGDLREYEKPLDGWGTYFASRRVLLTLAGEFPDLTRTTSLSVEGLAQFDVNEAAGFPEKLNTQYLEARFTAELLDPLFVIAGGIGEFAQWAEERQGSLALFAEADWEIPGALADMLSAEFLWTSGRVSGGMCAYMPVSGVQPGRIFDAGLGALMKGGLSYQARPHPVFSGEAGAAYFVRTDLETLGDGELDGASDSRLLGGEVYGSVVWAPDPAFRFNAGGGAFFPGWGGAFREGTPVRWKINLGLLMSL
jgi:hypothetical protein